jgi:hypothetical protein
MNVGSVVMGFVYGDRGYVYGDRGYVYGGFSLIHGLICIGAIDLFSILATFCCSIATAFSSSSIRFSNSRFRIVPPKWLILSYYITRLCFQHIAQFWGSFLTGASLNPLQTFTRPEHNIPTEFPNLHVNTIKMKYPIREYNFITIGR